MEQYKNDVYNEICRSTRKWKKKCIYSLTEQVPTENYTQSILSVPVITGLLYILISPYYFIIHLCLYISNCGFSAERANLSRRFHSSVSISRKLKLQSEVAQKWNQPKPSSYLTVSFLYPHENSSFLCERSAASKVSFVWIRNINLAKSRI